jgi:NAD-dependent DNA ligase
VAKTAEARGRWLKERRLVERGLAEMVGLVRGVIADGAVSSDEAARIARWAKDNPDTAARWPANLLARRLDRIYRDGYLDAKEREHLGALLAQLADNPGGHGFQLATDLPLDRPAPDVVFPGKTFVFAGEMAYGPRRSCEREVTDLGGDCERSVTRRTDYLVIGGLAATDWAQQTFGNMIDEAVQHRERGVSIAIISEDHWAESLP